MNTVNTIALIAIIVLSLIVVLQAVLYHTFVKQNQQKQTLAKEDVPQHFLAWKQDFCAAKKYVILSNQTLPKKDRDKQLISFYNQQLAYSEYARFKTIIDHHLCGFISRMEQQYPQLSEKDMLLIVLYLLETPDSEILTLTNMSPNSLPTTKSRLCKKLGVNHASNLSKFLISCI